MMDTATAKPIPQHSTPAGESHAGAWLVLGAAIVWSLGGILARLADVDDAWTAIVWRSGTASLFLLGFMLVRDGWRGTIMLFRGMGAAGLVVAFCFATASTLFVVALGHTTVANVLLMQAGVPLLAALISWILFRERLRLATWLAIAVVIGGVAFMVSDSIGGAVSPVGDGLALLIAFAFAVATVITRRRADIRMTPAVCTGAASGFAVAFCASVISGGSIAVVPWQVPVLIMFGLSMAVGMVLFTQGARTIPAAFAALLSTAETILGPFWVWFFLDETPSSRTLIGGSIVLATLIVYLAWQLRENHRFRRIAPPVN